MIKTSLFQLGSNYVSLNLSDGGKKLFYEKMKESSFDYYDNFEISDPEIYFNMFSAMIEKKVKELTPHSPPVFFRIRARGISENLETRGDSGHFMALLIQLESNQTYTVKIINTGLGIDNHFQQLINGINHVYPLTIQGIPLRAIINKRFLKFLLEMEITERNTTIAVNGYYSLIIKYLKNFGFIVKDGVPYPEQIRGTCIYSGLSMTLAQTLTQDELVDLKKTTAKSLLKELEEIKRGLPTYSGDSQNEIYKLLPLFEPMRLALATHFGLESVHA